MQLLRNLLWVSVITLMIWVYADMQFTDTMEFNNVTIQINTAKAPNVLLLNNREVPVSFKLRGSRSSLDRFRDYLSSHGNVIHYNWPESPTLPNGGEPFKIELQTADILRSDPKIEAGGLTVQSVMTQTINVLVDRRLTQDVPVEFDYTGATLVAPPTIAPATVTVYVAESKWKEIQKSPAPPVIKTRQVSLQSALVAQKETRTVELVPMISAPLNSGKLDVDVELDAKNVQVSYQVGQRIENRSLVVSVRLLTPATWAEDGTWREYVLSRKDLLEWRKQITVAGSQKDLQLLEEKKIDAYVILNEDDKTPIESWVTRDVVVRFPGDLALRVMNEKPTVSFKLVRKPAVVP